MAINSNKISQAFDIIEQKITFRELAPGAMVSEADLMDVTGLGRHPVRAALQRLAWQRMVEIHPRRGVIIPPISVEAQLKLLAVRRSVEELAVRWAADRGDPRQKSEMARLAAELPVLSGRLDLPGFGSYLKNIHEMIVVAAQNEYLQLSIAPLQGLSRRFWFANLRDVGFELDRAARLHAAVLLAMAEGDPDAAAGASLALNDYLTDFTYRSLRDRR